MRYFVFLALGISMEGWWCKLFAWPCIREFIGSNRDQGIFLWVRRERTCWCPYKSAVSLYTARMATHNWNEEAEVWAFGALFCSVPSQEAVFTITWPGVATEKLISTLQGPVVLMTGRHTYKAFWRLCLKSKYHSFLLKVAWGKLYYSSLVANELMTEDVAMILHKLE